MNSLPSSPPPAEEDIHTAMFKIDGMLYDLHERRKQLVAEARQKQDLLEARRRREKLAACGTLVVSRKTFRVLDADWGLYSREQTKHAKLHGTNECFSDCDACAQPVLRLEFNGADVKRILAEPNTRVHLEDLPNGRTELQFAQIQMAQRAGCVYATVRTPLLLLQEIVPDPPARPAPLLITNKEDTRVIPRSSRPAQMYPATYKPYGT